MNFKNSTCLIESYCLALKDGVPSRELRHRVLLYFIVLHLVHELCTVRYDFLHRTYVFYYVVLNKKIKYHMILYCRQSVCIILYCIVYKDYALYGVVLYTKSMHHMMLYCTQGYGLRHETSNGYGL